MNLCIIMKLINLLVITSIPYTYIIYFTSILQNSVNMYTTYDKNSSIFHYYSINVTHVFFLILL